jgi:hypothetical protein
MRDLNRRKYKKTGRLSADLRKQKRLAAFDPAFLRVFAGSLPSQFAVASCQWPVISGQWPENSFQWPVPLLRLDSSSMTESGKLPADGKMEGNV